MSGDELRLYYPSRFQADPCACDCLPRSWAKSPVESSETSASLCLCVCALAHTHAHSHAHSLERAAGQAVAVE